nr:hypothetical protein BaRGS_020552 [Batillaria attramentaria]
MYASQIVFSKAGKHQTPDTTESGNVTASDTLCGQTRPTTSRMLSHQQKNLNEEKKQTMVDLKAELFRKQEEFKRLKAAGSTEFVKGRKAERHGKTDIFSRKNAGVSQRAQLDLEKKEEEDNVMEKSRRALEAKSKIYEKIASRPDIPEEDGSDGYLVDFQRKAIDKIVEDRRKGEGQSINLTTEGDSDDDSALGELPLPPSNPDEEWVDYVDSFGRSRRCMKKDLPYLEKQERPLSKLASDLGLKVTSSDSPTLLSEDMRRELRRQQWEKEAQEAANGPIHYANVQFDEIRTHGVGYYQFSKDSNLREEQMDTLNKLREQTMEERMRSERIKEKRKAALEARLAKVKQRRKMKGGTLLDVEDSEDTAESVPTEQKADAVKVEKKTEPEPLTRDDSWRRDAPVREWDKGKEKMPEWNAKRYMEQRRTEREEEFAPPQIYFEPQQGLLTSEPGQQSSMMQQRTSGFSQPSTGKPTIPKMNLVDKRFMQNRELPIDDLLSEMEDSSKDILQHVKPVSYQPGIFSKSAVSDFLQPAAGVEAKVYQPGSFMAAKEAAAQRAEEGYEASRRKKQYSSAPVMYGQTSHTEVEKTDRSVKEGTETQDQLYF